MGNFFIKPNVPVPPDNQRTENTQANSWCRFDPLICLRTVAIEAGFLLAAFCILRMMLEPRTSPGLGGFLGVLPGPWLLLKFLVLFVFISYSARLLSDDLGNKVSFSAIGGIGGRVMTAIAPGFVSWK
jgi:hypothetical protein